MNKNKQQMKGYKMRNKVKKITAALITSAIFSTVVMSAANATCYGRWSLGTWIYNCY